MAKFIDEFREYSAPLMFDPEIADHVETLSQCDLGKDLLNSAEEHFVPILNRNLPKTSGGLYENTHPLFGQAVHISKKSSVFSLAHELRHAEQDNFIPREVLCPNNPIEFLLVKRMIEADANVIHTLATLQLVTTFGKNSDLAQSFINENRAGNEYAFHFLDNAELITNDSTTFKKIARYIFDNEMQESHNYLFYENKFATAIKFNIASKTKNFAINSLGLSICAAASAQYSPIVGMLLLMHFAPVVKMPNASFSRSTPDVKNTEKAMEHFGRMPNGQGNYITETQGISAQQLLEGIQYPASVERALETANKAAQKRENSGSFFNRTRDL